MEKDHRREKSWSFTRGISQQSLRKKEKTYIFISCNNDLNFGGSNEIGSYGKHNSK